MAEGPPESPGDRAYRRGFTRKTGGKGEDYAVDLFHEIDAHLDDLRRVDRLLLELGRFYNPVADGPIVDLASRQRVVGLLAEGGAAAAQAILQQLLARYLGAEPGPEAAGPR